MNKIILLSISLFITLNSSAQTDKKDITLTDIWASRVFLPKPVSEGLSMKDGVHFTLLEGDKTGAFILKYEYKTGKVVDTILKSTVLIPTGEKEPIKIDEYQFSADENKILISTATEPIYRHSTKSTNYVWDLKSKKLTRLSNGNKQMYATFSPSGSKVAYVIDNNLYVKDLANGVEKQITQSGTLNKIINGATDWVYEEEFSFSRAFFWNVDGTRIGYYQFDETNVKEFSMDMYGTLYPSAYKYKYPKAGEANSIVKIFIHDVAKGETSPVDIGKETDQYIPRIKWTEDPAVLSVQRLNRHQNKLELILANDLTKKSNVVLTETNDTYVDITDNLTFLKDKKSFIWSSEKDGYNHLYLYDISGKLIRQITKGNWDVMEYKGMDETSKTLFYISAEASAMERDLYAINIDGSKKKKLSARKGTNDATFSEGFKYYLNKHSDANTPYYISLHSADGKEIRVLEDNKTLVTTLQGYKTGKKEFIKVKTTDAELNAFIIKPADFDPNKKYPVFMTVYGGPGRNLVNNAWEAQNYLWHQLVAQKGYIVVCVDNRGTLARGYKFKTSTYKQLGKLETIDQIESAKYLATLPYVDKNRIGIQGWSYGGYLSSLCITKGADVFKAAIAVAPVTNWRYYDSIYTERFLQTPQENPEGYDENSPINFVKQLKGKFFLVHGAADDNVHLQNSMEMINALVKANKQFDLFIYPDKNHGIYGGFTRLHLFTKMTDFIVENI